MFRLWLVWRYLCGGGKFLTWTSILALFGMMVGVACLVVAMSVISGVQTLLKTSIIEITGHIILMRPGEGFSNLDEIESQVRNSIPDVVAMTPFVQVEAVLAHQGTLGGVGVQGIDPRTVDDVLKLRPRVIQGAFNFDEHDGVPGALIGKEIAKRFQIKPGDIFQIVAPKTSGNKASSFTPRARKFRLTGILDLGKYDYNERIIVTTVQAAQDLGDLGSVYTGLKIRIPDPKRAREDSFRLNSVLGYSYWLRDWEEFSQNFFQAVELEKYVIFVVLLFMVIVASFNISSTLFVSVLRRYSDISVLKTLGATKRFLVWMFVCQGLLIGFLGALGGLILGYLLCIALAHATWLYVPPEIYKFDHLPVEFRTLDLLAIFISAFIICFFSTFAPARRGARMNPVEGLRYE